MDYVIEKLSLTWWGLWWMGSCVIGCSSIAFCLNHHGVGNVDDGPSIVIILSSGNTMPIWANKMLTSFLKRFVHFYMTSDWACWPKLRFRCWNCLTLQIILKINVRACVFITTVHVLWFFCIEKYLILRREYRTNAQICIYIFNRTQLVHC